MTTLHKLWCDRTIPDEFFSTIEGVASYIGAGSDTPNNHFEKFPEAEAVIAGASRFDAVRMDTAPKLQVISRTGIGVDLIDIPAATERGIVICNAPDAPTIATAEQTLTLMLACMKRLYWVKEKTEQGDNENFYARYDALDAFGATLGLVGLGRIGGRVAKLAQAFEMKVQAYDPFSSQSHAASIGVTLVKSLEQLLATSDVISLHLPLVPETTNLMNQERFSQMKKDAVFVNAARGGLVDEAALLEALETGQLLAAGLDVTQVEPPEPDHPLLNRDDVILTPHIASGTREGKRRLWSGAINNALSVLKDEKPATGLVNPEVWENRRR